MNTTLLIYPIEKSRCSFKWKRAAPEARPGSKGRYREALADLRIGTPSGENEDRLLQGRFSERDLPERKV